MSKNIHIFSPSFDIALANDISQIGDRVEKLAATCDAIRKGGDLLTKHDCIYGTHLLNGLTIEHILYDRDCVELSRDQRQALRKIIERAREAEIDLKTVVENIDAHSENDINALLCLHSVTTVSSDFLIFSEIDWISFRRIFLGIYPVSEEAFVRDCIVCFQQLFFHSNVEKSLHTIEGGLTLFAKTIVFNLAALNDEFKKYCAPRDRVGTLRAFSSGCDVEATPEGNAKRKNDFTFKFSTQQGSDLSICCEPHLKLSKSDCAGDSRYYFNRIYFHEGKKEVAEGRILVAHIGAHL